MANVSSTTESALQGLIKTTIRAIVPAVGPSDRYRLRTKNQSGTQGHRDRLFAVHFEDYEVVRDSPVAGWTTGSMVARVVLVVEVDYSLEDDQAFPVITSDHEQIRQALHDLKTDGANGVWHVESEGYTNPPPESRGHYQAQHRYTVEYQRPRSF